MKLESSNVLLPLQLLAFVGLAVTFLQPIFSTSSRWIVLAVVTVFTALNRYGLRALPKRFTWLTAVFGCWSVATTFWSHEPLLTLSKASAFLIVTMSSLCVGYGWAWRHRPNNMMYFLAPLTLVALLAGILGRYSSSAIAYSGNMQYYQGLVGGSNMFGSMLAMCAPFVLWQLHLHWRRSVLRLIWWVVLLTLLYYLVRASSRAAIMIVIIAASSLVISVSKQKVALYVVLFASVVVFLFLLMPGQFEKYQRRLIYKDTSNDASLFQTREEVWRISLVQAKAGGIVGGGFGVSIDVDNNFSGGFTSVGYGREKGNSQLAILEEVGIVGFTIYCLSLLSLFIRLLGRIRIWPQCMEKRLLILLTGTLVAMLFGSFFEAWWVAPSSPESVYFWTVAGVALGVSGYNIGPEDALPGKFKGYPAAVYSAEHKAPVTLF